jgi:hypothetical protein
VPILCQTIIEGHGGFNAEPHFVSPEPEHTFDIGGKKTNVKDGFRKFKRCRHRSISCVVVAVDQHLPIA